MYNHIPCPYLCFDLPSDLPVVVVEVRRSLHTRTKSSLCWLLMVIPSQKCTILCRERQFSEYIFDAYTKCIINIIALEMDAPHSHE